MDLNGRHVLVLNNESDGSGNQVDLFTAPTTAKANKMIKAKKSLNISDEHGDQVGNTYFFFFSFLFKRF